MAEGRRPALRIMAVVPGEKRSDRDQFVEIGALWECQNDDGSTGAAVFSGKLVAVPVLWLDTSEPRKIVLIRGER